LIDCYSGVSQQRNVQIFPLGISDADSGLLSQWRLLFRAVSAGLGSWEPQNVNTALPDTKSVLTRQTTKRLYLELAREL
jgi:hypothetical protein